MKTLFSWSYTLCQFLVEAKSLDFNSHRLWSNIRSPLLVFQTVQLVEVLHCIIGLVPSNPFITFIQIITKVLIIWGIVTPFSSPKNSIGIFLMIGCWSVAEITRYLYYVLNILNRIPYILTWCRYSFFLILYPVGVTGELVTIYSSLNEISKNPNLSIALPNFLNFSFYLHIALVFVMLLYIPGKFLFFDIHINNILI